MEKCFDALYHSIKKLRGEEHNASLELLVLLGEFETKKYYRDAGYSSLFNFLVEGLKYSRPAASRRLLAARAVRDFPLALELLKRYELSLTTLSLVGKILTPENGEEILRSIAGLSRGEVELFLLERTENKAGKVVRDSVKPFVVRASKKSSPENKHALPLFEDREKAVLQQIPGTPGDQTTFEEENHKEVRYQVTFSASEEFMEKFQEVHALLAGKHGRDVSTEVVLEEALTLLLEKKSPKKREERRNARLKKQSSKKTTTTKEEIPSGRQPGKKASQSIPGVSGQTKGRAKNARTLPQKLRDKILARDGFQCTFVGADGTRCQEKTCLEVDHIDPRSLGGSDEEWNLQSTCRAHNLLLAERKLGSALMERYYTNSAQARST